MDNKDKIKTLLIAITVLVILGIVTGDITITFTA